MIRRRALDDVGGYDTRRFVEDYDMWLRLATRGYEFRYVDEALVRYRLSPLGASRNPATQGLRDESMAALASRPHGRVTGDRRRDLARDAGRLARQALAIDAALGQPLFARRVPLRPECEAASPSFRCRVAGRAVVVAVSLPGTSSLRDERLPPLTEITAPLPSPWIGVSEEVLRSRRSIPEVWQEVVAAYPDHLALEIDGETRTYAELDRDAAPRRARAARLG